MLIPMLTLSKVAVQETVKHGLAEGISRTHQTEVWQSAFDMLQEAAGVTAPTKSKAPGAPEKAKDGKPKLHFVTGVLPPPFVVEMDVADNPPWEWRSRLSSWAHAPPSPPPRVV